MIINYQEITTKKLQELVKLDPVIFIPNAPFEVHGLHLPLAADLLQAEKMARLLAEEGERREPERPWLLFPAIPAGVNPIPAKGSISHNFSLLVDLLKQTTKGILNTGIKNIIITNFHGSPKHLLAHDLVCDFVNNSGGKAFAPFGVLFKEFLNQDFSESINQILAEKNIKLQADLDRDIHAGFFETSLVMAISEQVEDLHRELPPLQAKEELKEIVAWLNKLKSYLAIFSKDGESFIKDLATLLQLSAHFNKHYYLGDPAQASKEMGEIIWEKIREKLVIMLATFLESEKISKDQLKSPAWKNRQLLADKNFEKILSAFSKVKLG